MTEKSDTDTECKRLGFFHSQRVVTHSWEQDEEARDLFRWFKSLIRTHHE